MVDDVYDSGNDQLRASDLLQFIGSGVLYRHPVFTLRYTEGVRYMAQKGRAYWLIVAIAIWQTDDRIRNDAMLQEIQFWNLAVNPDRSAVLACKRDTDDVVVQQEIPYTDFPLDSITLYVQNGILLLPSEY